MVVRPSKGGAFGHAVRLGRRLNSEGYESAIAGPHDRDLVESLGLRAFSVDIPRRPDAIRHPRAVAQLGRVYTQFAPTIVHAHGSQGGVIARLARSFSPRIPVAFSPHNYAFTNYFTSPVERGAYRLIETALSPLATRVICVCEAERSNAAKVGVRKRTRLVYNGIEPLRPSEPTAAVERLREPGPLISTVAELQPPKGVITLIESMKEVLRAHPTASLAIAGDGIERTRIETRISELGIGGQVHLLGEIDDVPGLLTGTDVFVQPGWSESFPYSILEAMSLGLPIVATDVGGVGEAIEDHVTGRLVPSQDSGRLAEAIASLLSNRERASLLGEAAQRRMMERFQFSTMFDKTLGVYREIGLP